MVFWSWLQPADFIQARVAGKLREKDLREAPFTYRRHVDNELQHYGEGNSGLKWSKQTQYDWNNSYIFRKTEKEISRSGYPYDFWG